MPGEDDVPRHSKVHHRPEGCAPEEQLRAPLVLQVADQVSNKALQPFVLTPSPTGTRLATNAARMSASARSSLSSLSLQGFAGVDTRADRGTDTPDAWTTRGSALATRERSSVTRRSSASVLATFVAPRRRSMPWRACAAEAALRCASHGRASTSGGGRRRPRSAKRSRSKFAPAPDAFPRACRSRGSANATSASSSCPRRLGERLRWRGAHSPPPSPSRRSKSSISIATGRQTHRTGATTLGLVHNMRKNKVLRKCIPRLRASLLKAKCWQGQGAESMIPRTLVHMLATFPQQKHKHT